MKKISNVVKEDILNSIKPGVSITDLSKRYSLSRASVSNILKHNNQTTKETAPGRKTLLSDRKKAIIARKFIDKEFILACDAVKWLAKNFDIHVSEETIRRCLKSNEIYSYKRIQKPALTDSHINKRRKFANRLSKWDFFDFKKIIFSDESKFNLCGADSSPRVWCKRNKRLSIENVKAVKKFGGGNLMVWGCITSEGVGKILRVSNRINSKEYCDVLRTGLVETLDMHSLKPSDILFMQDNAACHTSTETKNWLRTNKINLFEAPANSPDMNPIENVWDYLNKKVRSVKKGFNNADEMWEVIQSEWYKIPKKYISDLYFSMCSRVKALKEAKGEPIKY